MLRCRCSAAKMAKKAKSVAKPKKKGRQPDKAVASDTPGSHAVKCESKGVAVAHDKVSDGPTHQEDSECKMKRVRSIWEGLSDSDRDALLNVPVQDLIRQAAAIAPPDAVSAMGPGCSLPEVLESALKRKQEMSTWRIWIWPQGNEVFPCAEDLTTYVHENVLTQTFQQLLPHECLTDVESEEQAALRLRMRDVLEEVQSEMREHAEKMNDGAVKATTMRKMRRARLSTDEIVSQTKDQHIDMIIKMAKALSDEDDYLYQLVAFPINQFLNTTLPDSMRQSRYQMPSRPVTAAEVHFDELNSLPPDHVRTVFLWVHEKIGSFATALKKPPGTSEEGRKLWAPDAASIFILSEDGEQLTISEEWKDYLKEQSSQLDSGSSSMTADDLLLQWVYGGVVSEREKAHDGAKRALYHGQVPDGQSVYSLLRAALARQEKLKSSYESGMELLRCILKQRAKVEELVKVYPAMLERAYNKTDCAEDRGRASFPEDEFPTKAVIAQLEREQSLTLAKLHILKHRHDKGVATAQKLRQEQRRGEPIFERMRKRFEDAKQAQKCVESCRSAADVDRHRQQAADHAMAGQMQAQSEVRSQGTYLQGLSNSISECEQENIKQTNEIKQLSQWKHTITRTLTTLEYQEHGTSSSRADHVLLAISGTNALAGPHGHAKERQNFFETLRRQLYNDDDDHVFYSEVQSSLKELQKRLDSILEEHAACQAKQAEAELLLDSDILHQAAAPAKAAKKKKKPKPKQVPSKQVDVDASAKAAAEAARVRAEEQQRVRLEALERQRQLEDELLEKRKQELMQEEHGFWRQRMEQDKREKELMNTAQSSDCFGGTQDVVAQDMPPVTTAGDRQASAQSAVTEREVLNAQKPREPWTHATRDGRVVRNTSQTRKSNTAPHHSTPSNQQNSQSHSSDARSASRPSAPLAVREVNNRHGTHGVHSQAGSIPVRRLDEFQQATTSSSHMGHAGQLLKSSKGHERQCNGTASGSQETAGRRQTSAGTKATFRPADANNRTRNDQSNRQTQRFGQRQEYIATGEVVGVPVHTRADFPVPSASRTSSTDLHVVPKVEHVSHVNLVSNKDGQNIMGSSIETSGSNVGGSNSATLGTRPQEHPQLQPPVHTHAQPSAHAQGVGTAQLQAANQTSSATRSRSAQAAAVEGQSQDHYKGQHQNCGGDGRIMPQASNQIDVEVEGPVSGESVPRHVPKTVNAHHHAPPTVQGQHNSAQGPAPVHVAQPQASGVAATDSGNNRNDSAAISGERAEGASQSRTSTAQAVPVQPVAPGPYMPMACPHGGPSAAYPAPQHGMQTVYYAPVSMGMPNGGQQPFYVQHVDGMYMQPHPGHHYGMVYQPAHYQAVMHPVTHFPAGGVPHPQYQAMQWAPAKQLNAQAPAFVPGHVQADAGSGQLHPQMRAPPPGMYHMHQGRVHPQQHVPGKGPAAPDGVQSHRQPDSLRPSAVAGARTHDPASSSSEDRPVGQPDSESAATDSNSSSSTIAAEPCCEVVPDCANKRDATPIHPGDDAITSDNGVHPHINLATIRTDTAANKLRDAQALTSKSPRSPNSGKKRATKKARKSTALDTSKSLAALENQHEARYKLVGGRVGLRNRFGQNHCFLNVIVQALWHLKSFSTELMQLDVLRLAGRSTSYSEWRLLSALASLFREFEASNVAEESSPTLSPDGLRSALPSAFANEGDMHDAHEVLHEMFSALHFAQAGGGAASVDPTLPLVTFVPEAHVSRPPASSATETTWARRVGVDDKDSPSSLVMHTFGMRVQVPNPQESPLPGRIAVDRFVRYFHHVNTEPLINVHQEVNAKGKSFDWSVAVQQSGFDAGADVPLLSQPKVVTLTIVWHTARPNRRHIQDVCDTMQTAETLDVSKLFTGTKCPTYHHLRCVITYQHLHYIAFVHDESQGWLMLNDSRITKFGKWGNALEFMVEDDLLPIVLFYEN